jgi:hypothetical protein
MRLSWLMLLGFGGPVALVVWLDHLARRRG